MFSSPAFAQAAGAAPSGDMLPSLLPVILIFVVFYFLLLRPQQKRMKQHKEMLAALRRGDKVVTSGGIIGTVSKIVNEQEVVLDVGDNVKIRVVRPSIQEIVTKTEPVAGKDEAESEKPADK